MIARYPDKDAIVIVLSNVGNGDAGGLAAKVADALFGEKVELPWERKAASVDQKILERFAQELSRKPIP